MAIASEPAVYPVKRRANPTQRNFLYVVLGLVAFLAVLYQSRTTIDTWNDILHNPVAARTPFLANADYPLTIQSVEQEATNSGLRKGDQLMKLNGHEITGLNVLFHQVLSSHGGETMQVEVMRNGKPMTMNIALRSRPATWNDWTNAGLDVVLGLFLPWSSLVLGFYVAAVRPLDRLAWIVLGLLLTFSQVVNVDLSGWSEWVRLPAELFHTTLFSSWPLFMFLFGYFFPHPPGFDRVRPWIKYAVIVPYLVLISFSISIGVGLSENLKDFGPFAHYFQRSGPYLFAYTALMIGFGLTLLGMKVKSQTSSDAKRRLRLLLWGLNFALVPILLLSLYAIVINKSMEKLPPWLFLTALCSLLFFPLTLAYVIVVNRALDVRVVLRQGLQYAFARRGVAVLRVLTLALFGWSAYVMARRMEHNTTAQLLVVAGSVAATILINVSMKRLAQWVDRRFFRDAYNAEVVLSELSDQVRTIREPEPLVETVCDRISQTLHVSKLAVLLERDGSFRTFHATGFDPEPRVIFSRDSAVVRYLQQAREAPRVYFEDENSWIYQTPGVDDGERARLAYLGAELLLPLSTTNKLLGFITAGQKRSEEPYSNSDVRILSSVAAQTGLALENAQLTESIAAEMAQRERLAREVEIAREVQERLFPQKLPAVQGLDYAGMCRTALGVGGDYYDFLSLPGGRFGFAVGDVAGKGISAALLMASLQAILRGETLHAGDNLAELIEQLNKRVYEASTTNRYATFFYAQYAPETRKLDYVNAGHNPPVLLRRNEADWNIRLLEASGTVVGLLPVTNYEQSTLDLLAGDYLVAFTDGVSEAMNNADEEWGEERLNETVRACAESSLTAEQTMRRILSAADTFVSGAKQHDDMTLVVMRVL